MSQKPEYKYINVNKKNARKTCLPPPPLMIFSSKLEIGQSHSYEGSDNQKNKKNNKQNAVDGVNPVTPHAGKYVVKFNVYRTKREKSCHCHLRNSCPVPWQRWNFSRILCGAAGSLKLSLTVFPSNTTQDKQWSSYQCPYKDNYYNSTKRKSCSCTVSNCNCVKEAECQEQRPTEKAPSK